MKHRRLFAGAASAAVVLSMIAGVPAANAATTPPGGPDTVELTGELRVVPFEAPDVVHVLGEPAPEVEPEGDPTVFLRTDDGAIVELVGEEVFDAVSGSHFEGTVEVAGDVARSVARSMRTAEDTDADAVAELVADAAVAAEEPLVVESATVTPPMAAAVAPLQHKIEVAWLGPAGAPSATDADINAAIARMSEYWASESGGQITSIVRQGTIKRQVIPAADCDGMRYFAALDRAAKLFNRNTFSYRGGLHLLVLVPDTDDCMSAGFTGLADLGSGVHFGGTIWARMDPASVIDSAHTLAHEFGHNAGLMHSSVRECDDPNNPNRVDAAQTANGSPGNGCVDYEYNDYYDVMGGGYTIIGQDNEVVLTNNRVPAALNVSHKALIDALPRGTALAPVTIGNGDVQTFTLAAASAASGIRGLEVTDPRNGQKLYVEYRSGTGRDAQSLYAGWFDVMGTDAYRPGVRVLRNIVCPAQCTNYGSTKYSTVIQRHRDGFLFAPWHGAGMETGSYTGGVKVKVVSTAAASAVVQITLDDGLLKFTTKPTVSIGVPSPGGAYYGKTLTANGADAASWSPAPTTVVYQWLRNGVAIAGATAKTYQINGADIGAQITARATAVRSGYTTTAVTSAAVTPTGPTTDRVQGASRYETAVEVSTRAFPTTAPVVYVATGANYPDALAAAPAAATKGGPLLLVPSTGTVPAAVTARLAALDPARVVVVGGTGAVSAAVLNQIQAAVPDATVNRLFGTSRYDTGRALVRDAFEGSAITEVFVATGRNYPDALSASAVAGGRDIPVILVDGAKPTLDAASLDLIDDLGATKVTVVGGEGAVSKGIFDQLDAVYDMVRLSGASRYETSVAINAASFPGAVSKHYWATGTGFADALSGAVLAAVNNAPMYVVQPACVPAGVATNIGAKTTATVTLIGGPGALGANVAALARC